MVMIAFVSERLARKLMPVFRSLYIGGNVQWVHFSHKAVLERLALHLQCIAGGNALATLRQRAFRNELESGDLKFSDDVLLNAFRISFLLRDNASLHMAMRLVVDLCFQGSPEAASLKALMSRFTPSPYTLKYAELQVDGAYMLWWSDFAKSRTLWTFGKLDASPQAGLELMAHDVDVIDNDDIVDLVWAVGELELNPWKSEYEKHPSRDPLSDCRASLGRCLAQGIIRHARPLQAMGVKHVSLAHKVQTWLCAARLEHASNRDLADSLHYLGSLCTDMGTEFGVGDFWGAGLESLMPRWWTPPSLEPDVAGEAPMREPVAEPGHLCPFTLTIPGMLHIINNALDEMCNHMQHWERYLNMLKQVCRMLNVKAFRNNFVQSCLKVSAVAQAESWFQTAPPMPYEKRWGVVFGAIVYVLDRQTYLVAAWDEAKFNAKRSTIEKDALRDGSTSHLFCFVDFRHTKRPPAAPDSTWLGSAVCCCGLVRLTDSHLAELGLACVFLARARSSSVRCEAVRRKRLQQRTAEPSEVES